MATAKGSNSQLQVGSEATYKTTPTTFAGAILPFISETISGTQNLITNPEIRANRNPAAPVLGNKSVRGNISLPVHIDAVGWPLFYTLGAATTLADGSYATAVYTQGGVSDNNDISQVGSTAYTGTGLAYYEFEITTAAATDKFKWRKVSLNSLGTSTAGAYTENVNCDTSLVTIAEGVQVKWTSATSHEVGDIWKIFCFGQYHHTFKPATSLTYFEAERGLTDTADYFMFKGCLGESLGFTLSPEGILTLDWGMMGSSWAFSTASLFDSSTTYTSQAMSQFLVDGVYVGSTIDALRTRSGGTAMTTLPEIRINWTNNPEGAYAVGGAGEMVELQPTGGACSGSVTELFQDQTLLTLATGNTESSLLIGATQGNYFLQIFIPELTFQPQAVQIGGQGLLRQTLPFVGYYGNNAVQATSIQITLFNAVASYA